ncbi:MAG: hypothetical protein EBS84_02235 [Proteobacteria bacterium]|nr:hypothetical protein [Verrucomicrobiota bacterium]NBU07828.1 hypothetical protein [Pseudomonadota bacterium]
MNLFGLETESILSRVAAEAVAPSVPTLRQSLFIGGVGFGLVGLAAFAVWALGGRELGKAIGEGGLYAACALVFIGLAGAVFGQLVIGPGGTRRIYALFTVAFTAYSVVWTGAWFGLHGTLAAEVAGAVLGSLAMAGVLVAGFGAERECLRAATVLVVLNALGYFVGEVWWRWVPGDGGARLFGEMLNREQRVLLSQLGWGVLFGGGFGSGVGYVIYRCQHAVRVHLRTEIPLTPEA